MIRKMKGSVPSTKGLHKKRQPPHMRRNIAATQHQAAQLNNAKQQHATPYQGKCRVATTSPSSKPDQHNKQGEANPAACSRADAKATFPSQAVETLGFEVRAVGTLFGNQRFQLSIPRGGINAKKRCHSFATRSFLATASFA